MLIPQDIIDRVISETDIVELVGQYVTLSRAGSNLKGLCPFHSEKTPSFIVSPIKQIYHCFGCGAGGGVIQFITQRDKLTFPEALEKLADRLGITIPRTQSARPDSSQNVFIKINRYALWFFQEQLKNSSSAQKYLAQRGLSSAICERYGLGYAPDFGEALLRFLRQKSVPLNEASRLGLIRERGGSSGYYDFFRERLIFPIRSAAGRVIGFGGRDLSGQSPAKYVNSPESPIYNKSRELYGLYEARQEIIKRRQVIVVEGYIDVLACAQLGVPHAVAPLGTSLTSDQVRVLNRLGATIVLLFDGDEAGQKATLRALDLAFREGVHPQVLRLPEGTDPGDFLMGSHGDFETLLKQSQHGMDWLIASALARRARGPVDEAQQIRSLMNWIQKLPDPIEIDLYRKKWGEIFNLPRNFTDKSIAKGPQFVRNFKPDAGELKLEELLVYLFVKDPESFPQPGLDSIAPMFEDSVLADLARAVLRMYGERGILTEAQIMSQLDPVLQERFSHLLMQPWRNVEDYSASECLQKWRRLRHRSRLKEITQLIAQADLVQDTMKKNTLLEEKQKLLKQGAE